MPISFLSIVESGCHTFSFPGWPSKQICLDNEKSTRKSTTTIPQSLKITENSLIQHCERSELRLHFEWTEVHQKCQKWLEVKQCYQTGQFRTKLVENTKIDKIQMRHFFDNFQTMCLSSSIS